MEKEIIENGGIAKALDAAYALGMQTAKAQNTADGPVTMEINGRIYTYESNRSVGEKWVPIREYEEPEYHPGLFTVATLTGLVDWISDDPDKLFTADKPESVVLVESPTHVSVYSAVTGKKQERIKYAEVRYAAPDFRYNEYMDSEMLCIKMQTCFLQDECRDVVLRVVNNVTEEQTAQTADDGISQRVTVKTGIQAVDSAVFKNPAYLHPMRTFTEVEQPESPFVVRFKEGGQAALFEADGGKWKAEAIRVVGKYLKEKLFSCNVVVIA